jgi:S-adenosylmethionine:tRNA ribosyltransferase-isomerase
LRTDSLDFDLPEELIAQRPAPRRDASRLLVVDRAAGTFSPVGFQEIGNYLRRGDCLVLNDTRVIRARVEAHKISGGRIEIFLLREDAPGEWTALLRPSAKAKPGTRLELASGMSAIAGEVLPDGKRRIRFDRPDVLEELERVGRTFKPVTVDDLAEHKVDAEDFEVSEATATQLNATRAQGGRVVAVGTTATRVLETQYREGCYHPGAGQTTKYIYPPYVFGGVDVLQTNFHLPRSSLLALVAAFAGPELIREAYRFAIAERFRFYSYGDAMLIV